MPENTVVISTDEYEALIRAKVTLDVVKTVMSITYKYQWEYILPAFLGVEVKTDAE